LGADKVAFSFLTLDGCNLVCIDWLMPEKKETIESYAARMAACIKEDNPILMGLSFGGMLCIEIAKLMPVRQVILVSSISNRQQMPRWMRIAGSLKLDKIVPLKPFKIIEPIQNRRMGVTTRAEINLVNEFRDKTSQVFIDWAVHVILNWKNEREPEKFFHIHGDDDKIFPIHKTKPTHILKNAGHFMIMNRATEVSSYLNQILKD